MNATERGRAGNSSVSNTDLVLVALFDLGGGERAIDAEDVAEAAWRAVPARFSWPKHQQYPDLDAVDVTLRAAKKNSGFVAGAKTTGWMLTLAGSERVQQCQEAVREYIAEHGADGRAANRRERGGADSSTARRLRNLRDSEAAAKARHGALGDATVYDFLAFFEINQYMPEAKYKMNRQRVLNVIGQDAELLPIAEALHDRFGSAYKSELLREDPSHV